MYTRMLIPLDGSLAAEKVLPYARLVARRFPMPVELLGAVDVGEVAAHTAPEKARYLNTVIADEERSSRIYLQRIAGSFPEGAVRCTVERGRPAEVIIDHAAKDKDTLIAMATHGRSGLSRWMLGSVTEKVLRGSGNPLLLVRADAHADAAGEAALSTIIVPLDGSALAEAVLPKAVELARTLRLEIVLARVYELPATAYYGSEDYLPNYEELKHEVEAEAREYLAAKVEALKAQGVEKVSLVLLDGADANEIIRYARAMPSALVAMCTHGRSGVKRWVLGSVTEKVVRHSGDPVLVVRAGAGSSAAGSQA